MNYKQTNAFYDWLLYNSLPTGAIALWHALAAINNKAGWAEEFTVANLVLQSMTGLSRQGLDKARNVLVQKGLIEYKKGTSNKAGKYKMIWFERQKVGTVVDTEVGTVAAQKWAQEERKSSTLNKLNININKNSSSTRAREDDFSKIVNFYNNNFGMITAHISDCIQDWLKDMEGELIIRAMEIAIENNKRKWAYVEGILRQWHAANITTIELLKAYKVEHDRNRQSKGIKKSKFEENLDKVLDELYREGDFGG